MQPKPHMTKKERVAEYGSFLYCPKHDTICSAMDNDDGVCRRSVCYREDPEYLEKEKQIQKNIRENARREQEERRREKAEPPAPIRRQTRTEKEAMEKKIEWKMAKAQRYYRINKPKVGDSIMAEVRALSAKLKKGGI